MKTKDLIAALQKEDPSGELEVVSGNIPIYFVERLPAFYDGDLQMLVQTGEPNCYNITGYKVTDKGDKVKLHLIDLEGVLSDNPDAPIDLTELRKQSVERWEVKAKAIREEYK